MFKIKKIKKSEFQGVLFILIAALVLTGLQTSQLYSVKKTLAKEGLGVFSQGGTGSLSGQSSGIPDQVGGCFR